MVESATSTKCWRGLIQLVVKQQSIWDRVLGLKSTLCTDSIQVVRGEGLRIRSPPITLNGWIDEELIAFEIFNENLS